MSQYEIHLTVDPADLDKAVQVLNLQWDNKTKGLLFANTGKGELDAMTSCKMNLRRFEIADSLARSFEAELKNYNIETLRTKIESNPFNNISEATESAYWESHLPIMGNMVTNNIVPPDYSFPVLFSRNVRKGNRWATIRTSIDQSFTHHQNKCESAAAWLLARGIQTIGKPHHEIVLFDSNRDHDKGWE